MSHRDAIWDVESGGAKEACIRLGSRSPMCRDPLQSAMSCAKTAEPIKMPYGMWTPVGPRNHALDDGAHWHHLANTIEPSMCAGNTTLCQITSAIYYYYRYGVNGGI